jgi:hypothetical protein
MKLLATNKLALRNVDKIALLENEMVNHANSKSFPTGADA